MPSPAPPPEGFETALVSPPEPDVNEHFYRTVGEAWGWTDRLAWSEEDWTGYVRRPELQTWLGRCHGAPVGYFELEHQSGGNVQIVYFGILSEFIGKGFGRALLDEAVRAAWSIPTARRLWVHTCTKDHPHALGNYLRRGFHLYKTETRGN